MVKILVRKKERAVSRPLLALVVSKSLFFVPKKQKYHSIIGRNAALIKMCNYDIFKKGDIFRLDHRL